MIKNLKEENKNLKKQMKQLEDGDGRKLIAELQEEIETGKKGAEETEEVINGLKEQIQLYMKKEEESKKLLEEAREETKRTQKEIEGVRTQSTEAISNLNDLVEELQNRKTITQEEEDSATKEVPSNTEREDETKNTEKTEEEKEMERRLARLLEVPTPDNPLTENENDTTTEPNDQDGKKEHVRSICKYHKLQSGCLRRESCKYSYPPMCKYYLWGFDKDREGCFKKEKCNFTHQNVCYFSMEGKKCTRARCRYYHMEGNNPNKRQSETRPTYERRQDQEGNRVWYPNYPEQEKQYDENSFLVEQIETLKRDQNAILFLIQKMQENQKYEETRYTTAPGEFKMPNMTVPPPPNAWRDRKKGM